MPVYVWLFYMTTLVEAYVCFFALGLGFGGSISINVLYMQEFLQKKHRAFVLMTA